MKSAPPKGPILVPQSRHQPIPETSTTSWRRPLASRPARSQGAWVPSHHTEPAALMHPHVSKQIHNIYIYICIYIYIYISISTCPWKFSAASSEREVHLKTPVWKAESLISGSRVQVKFDHKFSFTPTLKDGWHLKVRRLVADEFAWP